MIFDGFVKKKNRVYGWKIPTKKIRTTENREPGTKKKALITWT